MSHLGLYYRQLHESRIAVVSERLHKGIAPRRQHVLQIIIHTASASSTLLLEPLPAPCSKHALVSCSLMRPALNSTGCTLQQCCAWNFSIPNLQGRTACGAPEHGANRGLLCCRVMLTSAPSLKPMHTSWTSGALSGACGKVVATLSGRTTCSNSSKGNPNWH